MLLNCNWGLSGPRWQESCSGFDTGGPLLLFDIVRGYAGLWPEPAQCARKDQSGGAASPFPSPLLPPGRDFYPNLPSAVDAAGPDSNRTGGAERARNPESMGGWHLVRTRNPYGGADAISIMRTADASRSDLDLAGLMIRCAGHRSCYRSHPAISVPRAASRRVRQARK
jgi:hypothetical protein